MENFGLGGYRGVDSLDEPLQGMKALDDLRSEWRQVGTKKFHLIERVGDREIFEEGLSLGLPRSYMTFLREVGAVKLYRQGDGYDVGVYPVASTATLDNGDTALCFGHSGSKEACFLMAALNGDECAVYELIGGKVHPVAQDFCEWLKTACEKARRQYGKHEWAAIIRGPQPFSDEEVEIVEARKKFSWNFQGVTPAGKAAFLVSNCSSLRLKFFSMGARHKGGRFDGGLWLNVKDIAPGQEAVVGHDCYSELAPISEHEFYDLPDPGPEDRERYWEFRT